MIAVADAVSLPFKDDAFDMVMGSPPYCAARDYGIGAGRGYFEWHYWMYDVTKEAMRVCRGPVLWVCAGTGNYEPGPEGLIYFAKRNGFHVYRPCIWTANKPPTGQGWFSNEWEYVLCFSKVRPLPYWNPSALGLTTKYKSGGHFRQRGKDGIRKQGSEYPTGKDRKRPGNVFRATVGGGHMGSPLAHENEAPYPETIVEPFVLTLCPPGGKVLDPFSGSGTTAAVCKKLGRVGVSSDIRPSQAELTAMRLVER